MKLELASVASRFLLATVGSHPFLAILLTRRPENLAVDCLDKARHEESLYSLYISFRALCERNDNIASFSVVGFVGHEGTP